MIWRSRAISASAGVTFDTPTPSALALVQRAVLDVDRDEKLTLGIGTLVLGADNARIVIRLDFRFFHFSSPFP
jgi:hypothetical protein